MQILFVHSKVCLYLWKQGLWHPIFEYEMNAIFKFFCGRCSFLVAQFDYSRILKSSYFFLEQLKPFTESYIIFFYPDNEKYQLLGRTENFYALHFTCLLACTKYRFDQSVKHK